MLALTGQPRRWDPKKLRLRLFSAAAQLVTTGRRRLRFTTRWPWTNEITRAIDRLNWTALAVLPRPAHRVSSALPLQREDGLGD
ncbi:hypothetical protein SSPO_077960 [Streptomyces antimycoticus]|uniref:Transposase DDE domain-containing protein n=1 Tax=Streptomyces antimycoticus TaxID=68175 RepID=A0A499UYD7_9ACTN|nr:hypothetical protein SSPO_077960 [Streptomyces antimycoticus]